MSAGSYDPTHTRTYVALGRDEELDY